MPSIYPMKIARSVLIAVTVPAHVFAQQFPAERWPSARPADVGISAAVLDSIDSEVKAGRYGYVDRIVVIRNGKLIWDRSYQNDYVKAYDSLARIESPLNAHDPTGPYNY